VTVRHAVLPVGAVLVLGLGVYLFVEVRAQPAPPQPVASDRPSPPAPMPQPAAPRNAPVADSPSAAPAPPAVVPRAAPAPAPHEVAAAPALPPEPAPTGPKLDAVMSEANKAYDRGDFEDAKLIAGRLLASYPTNVRMLRIMVSASCIDGDSTVAQAHYAKLPPADQEQMKVRCARYGVLFADKP
jgi:hypothetical protein